MYSKEIKLTQGRSSPYPQLLGGDLQVLEMSSLMGALGHVGSALPLEGLAALAINQ